MRELAAENILATDPVVPYQKLGFCVSVDLDVSVGDGSLLAAAAYQPRTGDSLSLCGGPVNRGGLQCMERIAGGARFLMGDNVIAFDIPHLQEFAAELSLLRLPVVDTLRLNLLAFPRRLYHHLVKNYKDGGLVAGSATTRC